MMPHCKRESQFELFETHAVDIHATPRLELPFQRSQEIDMPRLCAILGVSKQTATRMLQSGLICGYKASFWRIQYDSVVAFCNRLRIEYRISDRTAPRPRTGRMRDRDLLPFPLADTVYMQETTDLLGCSIGAVIHLIDEGTLVAYKVTLEGAGCRWRIHRPSLERYIAGLHAAAAAPSLHRRKAAL